MVKIQTSKAKKILSLMLTLAMVVSMFACMSGLDAFAVDINAGPTASEPAQKTVVGTSDADFSGDNHIHRVCYGAESLGDKAETDFELVTYKPLTQDLIKSGKLPVNDNYYLAEDIEVTAQTTNIGNLNLCLNGHSITMKGTNNYRLLYAGYTGKSGKDGAGKTVYLYADAKLNLCDCDHSGNGNGVIKRSDETPAAEDWSDNGGILMAASGDANVEKTAKGYGYINMFGGVIDAAGRTVKKGGAVYSGTGFNMYGGTIKNGVAKTVDGKGGNICINAGDFNMVGGTIENGKAYAVDKEFSGAGGNIYVNGTAKITGGTISGGSTVASATKNTGLGGNIYVNSGSLELSGCTITGGKCEEINLGTATKNDDSRRGGNVYIASDTKIVFDIHEGTVIENGVAGRQGGNVWTSAGTLTMDGGIVRDGTSAIQGGNLRLGSNSTISGGTISGGTVTDTAGGNLFFITGTNTITGTAVIEGGKAQTKSAGNVSIYSGTLNITGGTIRNGSAKTYGGNIDAFCGTATSKTTVNVTGGAIYGGKAEYGKDIAFAGTVITTGAATLNLNGAVATNGTNPELYIANDKLATVGAAFAPEKAFAVNYKLDKEGDFAIATGIAADKAACFTTNNLHALQVAAKDADTLAVVAGGSHCICGGNAAGTELDANHVCDTTVEWTPWTSKTALPGAKTSAALSADNGKTVNYFLTEDVTLSSVMHYVASEPTVINICLNGHKILKKTGASRLFYLRDARTTDALKDCNITINICDCKGEAKVECEKRSGDQGQLIWNTYASGTVNIFGGTFDGTNLSSTSDGATIANSGTINVYGGEIIGSTGNKSSFTTAKSFNVYGGIIRGGVVKLDANKIGAGIIISAGTLNIKGGKIYGATIDTTDAPTATYVNGGALYIKGGSVTMTGGEIYGSDMPGNGGAVCIPKEATGFTFTGGTIYAGNVSNAIGNNLQGLGGAVFANSNNFTMSDDAVIDATGKTSAYGVALAVGYGGAYSVKLDGGTIKGGTATINGGAISVWDNASLEIDGTTVTGGSATNGGSIFVGGAKDKACSLTITSGTVEGGNASVQGGNIYVKAYSSLAITGGTVKDGTARKADEKDANGQGGNIYFNGMSGTFEISGSAVISGGSADQGGNIWHNAGTFNMSSGLVKDGTATFQGGNIRLGAISNISGGRIENGTVSNSNGGNIFYIAGGNKAVISGTAEIVGGKALASDGKAAYGGNISVYQGTTLEMTGGLIADGDVNNEGVDSRGGNIALISSRTVDKDDDTKVTYSIAKFVMTGGTVSGGKSTSFGGNIFASEFSFVEISGENTVVKDGESTAANGGNIGTNFTTTDEKSFATVTVTGGATIKDGKSKGNGGNIYLHSHCQGLLDGAKVYGGETQTDYAKSIFVGGFYANKDNKAHGKIVIKDSTVTGGDAAASTSDGTVEIIGNSVVELVTGAPGANTLLGTAEVEFTGSVGLANRTYGKTAQKVNAANATITTDETVYVMTEKENVIYLANKSEIAAAAEAVESITDGGAALDGEDIRNMSTIMDTTELSKEALEIVKSEVEGYDEMVSAAEKYQKMLDVQIFVSNDAAVSATNTKFVLVGTVNEAGLTDYSLVGFNITINGVTKQFRTATVYRNLTDADGSAIPVDMTCEKSDAIFFCTLVLPTEAIMDKDITVTSVVILTDESEVTGKTLVENFSDILA